MANPFRFSDVRFPCVRGTTKLAFQSNLHQISIGVSKLSSAYLSVSLSFRVCAAQIRLNARKCAGHKHRVPRGDTNFG